MAKSESKVGLLRHLSFAGEARGDGNVSPPLEEGRFRYLWHTFRKNNGLLMLSNLLLIATLLPLIAVLVILAIFGPEKLSYMLGKVTELPYFMSGIGMGVSSTSSVVAAKLEILKVYGWAFLFGGVSMLFVGIGFAGMFHVGIKFIWKDTFVYKKDTYGNNVPRVIIEFFRGIKRNWWQMLIASAILGVLVAGVGNVFVFFLSKFYMHAAGGGEWVLLIFSCILALFGGMFLMYLFPMIAMYDLPLGAKMKNAAVLTVQMFVQNIFILAFIALPFILVSVTSGFINVLLVAVLLVFGGPFYVLLMCNYAQYYAEKIITPVYQAQFAKGKKKRKGAKA